MAKRDGVLGLATLALVTAAGVPPRTAFLAGIAGAAIARRRQAGEFFFGFNPLPARLDQFHKRIQRESPEGMRTEVAIGIAAGRGVRRGAGAARRRGGTREVSSG